MDGVENLRAAIKEYNAVKRSGMSPDQYNANKQAAYDLIKESLGELKLKAGQEVPVAQPKARPEVEPQPEKPIEDALQDLLGDEPAPPTEALPEQSIDDALLDLLNDDVVAQPRTTSTRRAAQSTEPRVAYHYTLPKNVQKILKEGFNTSKKSLFARGKVGKDVIYLTLDENRWNKASVYVGKGKGNKDYTYYDYNTQKWITEKKALQEVNLTPIEVIIKGEAKGLVIDSYAKWKQVKQRYGLKGDTPETFEKAVEAAKKNYDYVEIKRGKTSWKTKEADKYGEKSRYETITGKSGDDDIFVLNKDVISFTQKAEPTPVKTQPKTKIVAELTGDLGTPNTEVKRAKSSKIPVSKDKASSKANKPLIEQSLKELLDEIDDVPSVSQTLADSDIKPPAKPPKKVKAGTAKPKPEKFAKNIRLSKFDASIRKTIVNFAKENPDAISEVTRGIQHWEDTNQAAQALLEYIGSDVKKLIKPIGQAYNSEEQVALIAYFQNNLKKMEKLSDKIKKGEDSTVNKLLLEDLALENGYLQLMLHAATAEAGRALQIRRQIAQALKTNEQKAMEKALRMIKDNHDPDKLAAALAEVDWKDVASINRFIRNFSKVGVGDYVYELFINSILSGHKTHIVNALSNTLNEVLSPVEGVAGAVVEKFLAKVQHRNPERYFSEAPSNVVGAIGGVKDGLRAFARTIKTGESDLALSKLEFKPHAFKGKFGRAVNIPSTTLEAADALYYWINQRQALYQLAHRKLKAKGLKGEKFNAAFEELIKSPTKDLLDAADKISNQRLFRSELGKTTSSIMAALNNTRLFGFPVARFFIPFVRTPANIVKFGLERSPAGFVNPALIRNLLQKSPEASDQLGRALLGTGICAGIWLAFKDGKITGKQPTSKTERDEWYLQGKQPYSIKIGDKWINYQRIEPYNQLFSMVAAVVNAEENKDEDAAQAAADAIVSLSQNFVSQSYMSGLADIMDALNDPEKYGKNWIQRFAGSMLVPYSAMSRTIAQSIDPYQRKPETFADAVHANIPFMSQTAPIRTTSSGLPMKQTSGAYSPITVTTDKGGGSTPTRSPVRQPTRTSAPTKSKRTWRKPSHLSKY